MKRFQDLLTKKLVDPDFKRSFDQAYQRLVLKELGMAIRNKDSKYINVLVKELME